MPNLAIHALARLAIGSPELDEGLRGECVVAIDARMGKAGDKGIVLRLEILEQRNGLVGHGRVAREFAVGIQ